MQMGQELPPPRLSFGAYLQTPPLLPSRPYPPRQGGESCVCEESRGFGELSCTYILVFFYTLRQPSPNCQTLLKSGGLRPSSTARVTAIVKSELGRRGERGKNTTDTATPAGTLGDETEQESKLRHWATKLYQQTCTCTSLLFRSPSGLAMCRSKRETTGGWLSENEDRTTATQPGQPGPVSWYGTPRSVCRI